MICTLIVTNPGGPHVAHKHIIDTFKEYGKVDIIKIGKINLIKSLYQLKKFNNNYSIIFFEDVTLSKILNVTNFKNNLKIGLSADRLIYALLFKPKWYLIDGLPPKSLFPFYYYKYLDYGLTKTGIKKLDAVICVSPLMERLISTINENTFIVRPLPSFQDHYKKNIIYFHEKDENLIFSISRGGTFKGVDILIKAFIKLKRKYANLKLILLGNKIDILFKYRYAYNYFLNKYKQDIKIIFDYLPKELIINYYRKSLIYLQPSYFDPCPTAVFDAIIFENLPIVTSMVGSKDFVDNKLISEPNLNDIINKIEFVINLSENEKKQIIKKMKRKIPTTFYENQKKIFKDVLKEIISKNIL